MHPREDSASPPLPAPMPGPPAAPEAQPELLLPDSEDEPMSSDPEPDGPQERKVEEPQEFGDLAADFEALPGGVSSDQGSSGRESSPSSSWGEESEEEGAPVVVPDFAAPEQGRHRLAKFNWLANPLKVRIHSLAMQHYVFHGTRAKHTEATIKSLGAPGLGLSALSPLGQTMLTANTYDFRTYVRETVPSTKTSSVID